MFFKNSGEEVSCPNFSMHHFTKMVMCIQKLELKIIYFKIIIFKNVNNLLIQICIGFEKACVNVQS